MSGRESPDPLVELRDRAHEELAVLRRTMRHERHAQQRDLATLTGTLHDVAQRQTPVVLVVGGGRYHRGTVGAVGVDHLAFDRGGHGRVLVSLASVRVVRPEPGVPRPDADGDRGPSDPVRLVEALGRLAEKRSMVTIAVEGADDLLHGVLTAVGEDLVTVRSRSTRSGHEVTSYVPLNAICEVAAEDAS